MIGNGIAPALAAVATWGQTVPLQGAEAEAEGGSALVVGLVLVTFVVAAVLSTAIAYRLYVGYRGSGDRSMLAIAVGLLLVTTVPTVIRIVIPTVIGDAERLRVLAATTSEFVGLLAIVVAVRTPSRSRHRVRRDRATVLPLVAVAVAVTIDHVVWLSYGVTPLAGIYVTWLAYRGYRRNDSEPMAYLALGIFLLTVLPAVAAIGLGPLLGASDAASLLAASISQLGGLLSVYYSLTRA